MAEEEVLVNVNGNSEDQPQESAPKITKEPPPPTAPKPNRRSICSVSSDVGPPSNYQPPQQPQGHMSAEQMDEQRKQNIAYEYLCHLEESKVWMQACINEELPATTELEEGLRNGVYLAKLAHFMAPNKVTMRKIYDKDQARFKARGLHFRHTDNINQWFIAMEEVGLPKIFYPETTDIYDRKNMPRTIYCLHALSLYLFKLGMAPQIEDLYGKVNFTEEEISAMRQELDKYGIQMPTFSKIGGILANELSEDDAALHAAIIAINEAIEMKVTADILTALGNPAANLMGINEELGEDYASTLYQAKQTKSENTKNKKADQEGADKEFDVYDEMLTQAELQGNLNCVNTSHSLSCINDALVKEDKDAILKMLKSSHLGIKNVKDENLDYYVTRLQEARQQKKNNNNGEEMALDKEDIQQAVNAANLDADTEYQKSLAVQSINQALETGDSSLLMKTLQNPRSQLPEVHDFARGLYFEEFKNMREETESDLSFEEIYGAVKVLSAVAAINRSIDTGHPDSTWNALNAENACIDNLDEELRDRYQKSLEEAKAVKLGESCDLLTHHEISEVIDQANQLAKEEHLRILAIGKINECIDEGVAEETVAMLKMPDAQLENVEDKQTHHYQLLLIRCKKQKAQTMNDSSAELWVDEIQSCVNEANDDAKEGIDLSMGVAAINDAVEMDSNEALLTALGLPHVGITGVLADCAPSYLQKLKQIKEEKAAADSCGSGWMMNRTKGGAKFFFNTKTMQYAWTRTDDIIKDNSLLTKEEIQKGIQEITDGHNRELLFEANEDFIVQVQALVRGYLTRRRFNERKTFLCEQSPTAVKIQAHWKGYKQRKAFKERMDYLEDNSEKAVKIQSLCRMWLAKKRYKDRRKYFKDHEAEIIKIQAFVRSNKAKHDYQALMYDKNPPLNVVRRFVHLLDTSDADYAEELELQRIRQQVVKEIKSNQQLEHDLDQMDVKIGLLIKNRITLQDVVMHNKKLAKQTESQASSNRRSAALPKGLKVMTKESHDRVEAYQHLFYLLQTNPSYLAKLIFEMPQDKTTKFMESVIYSLFNYGSNLREEYLLAKLFKTALEEEIIKSKVEKITDIVTGNPLVIKMIVGFNRNQRGQNALKEMLQPLVQEVINDKNMKINTNPVEVYKVWVNQQESETGKTSELPYDVSSEQALKHEAVAKLVQESTAKLQSVTDKFLNAILQSVDKIPYGMRYMAKVLKAALEQKFPEAVEKDILKIVGNLLYYRYINPAIVAPDVFDIINVSVEKALTTDQRRNLGSIAKILQFAAANKGFGGDSNYLAHMNTYIKDAHEKFKKYCLAACDVEEPEVKFNIDQYTDVTMITKPLIYISVQEIVDTHSLLLEHQDTIAPDPNDPLHELLEDLGEVQSSHELLGVDIGENEALEEQIHSQLAKTEMTLTLTNKFELPDDDQTDIKTLLIRTKRLVMDVIACQQGETLAIILDTPATEDEEELHGALVKKRDLRDKRAAKSDKTLVRHQSMLGDCRLPLHLMKTKIKKSLQSLELENMVSRKDGFQTIINLIAQDIRNQRRYRNNRKQELFKLRNTLKSLGEKRQFYEAQVDYYNQYVKTCMDNLQSKGRSHKAKANKNARKAQGTIKYSGAKLHEKGVILEIEGLKPNQFKNALFVIAATAESGVFEISAKFMGIDVEKVDLNFQELLQLQYEGVAVMEMFGKTKINVNLLIFLINKKFYSGAK